MVRLSDDVIWFEVNAIEQILAGPELVGRFKQPSHLRGIAYASHGHRRRAIPRRLSFEGEGVKHVRAGDFLGRVRRTLKGADAWKVCPSESFWRRQIWRNSRQPQWKLRIVVISKTRSHTMVFR